MQSWQDEIVWCSGTKPYRSQGTDRPEVGHGHAAASDQAVPRVHIHIP